METVTILVDVQNIYYTVRQGFKRNFDYNAFWAKMSSQYEIKTAIAYAIDRGDDKQRQFQNILRAIGFEVKLKPFIQRADGTAKGDWDVGITIDAIKYGQDTDRVILLSGDGDFGILATELRNCYNTQVDVYGVDALTSNILVNACNNYIAIDESLLL